MGNTRLPDRSEDCGRLDIAYACRIVYSSGIGRPAFLFRGVDGPGEAHLHMYRVGLQSSET